MHPVLFHFGPLVIPSYGVLAALGVLLALALSQRTARMVAVDPAQIWNLSILALFAALAGSRLLLIAINFSDLRQHPAWLLTLAMVHHPLLAAAGCLLGLLAAGGYARWRGVDPWSAADALAAPLALGLAFEQVGALLAGSGYGVEVFGGWAAHWAVTYTDLRAALWSGAPLAEPLHPVQAYAALFYLTLAAGLLVLLPARRQRGDNAGLGLVGIGIAIFFTEFWRDWEGRGSLLGGTLDAPQAAAILLVLCGAALLWKQPQRQMKSVGNEEVDG